MDEGRLSWALKTSLMPYTARSDPEDLEDVIQFLVSECMESGLSLPTADTTASQDENTEEEVIQKQRIHTLEELLSHPLTSILEPHLVDLLNIPPQEISFVVDEFLDAYWQGVPDDAAQEGSSNVSPNGARLCELCERPATLTEHHLLPRTEHALLVKRGQATLTECECTTEPSRGDDRYSV